MTISYVNGVKVFSTDAILDSLASSTTLVAGYESPKITLGSADKHVLSGRFKTNNTAPTAGKIEVWCIPVWDIGGVDTYPDVFDGTESVETVGYRNVLIQSGYLVASFDTDVTANRVYEFGNKDLSVICGEQPKNYVIFITQSTAQNLNATANNGGQVWYTAVTY